MKFEELERTWPGVVFLDDDMEVRAGLGHTTDIAAHKPELPPRDGGRDTSAACIVLDRELRRIRMCLSEEGSE